MSMCELDEFQTISEMRKKIVISKDDLKIGRIIDVVFDSDYNLHSFIIGGSRWEELKEFLGFIDDVDPVIPVASIQEITKDSIKLSVLKSKLKDKLEEGVIPNNAFTYSSLKRKKIYDSKDRKFGKIVNMVFLPCGEASFIIGGTWFEELSETLKFKENIDLLLPVDLIHSIDEKSIRLNIPYEDLHISIDNKPMDDVTQRAYLNSLKVKGSVKMRLLERRKGEEFRDFSKFM